MRETEMSHSSLALRIMFPSLVPSVTSWRSAYHHILKYLSRLSCRVARQLSSVANPSQTNKHQEVHRIYGTVTLRQALPTWTITSPAGLGHTRSRTVSPLMLTAPALILRTASVTDGARP